MTNCQSLVVWWPLPLIDSYSIYREDSEDNSGHEWTWNLVVSNCSTSATATSHSATGSRSTTTSCCSHSTATSRTLRSSTTTRGPRALTSSWWPGPRLHNSIVEGGSSRSTWPPPRTLLRSLSALQHLSSEICGQFRPRPKLCQPSSGGSSYLIQTLPRRGRCWKPRRGWGRLSWPCCSCVRIWFTSSSRTGSAPAGT